MLICPKPAGLYCPPGDFYIDPVRPVARAVVTHGHADHARAVDLPIAGLLTDLKRRGLLDDTIVWWGGEFGRTPYAERNGTGRDHNPNGFTMWLAGGGVRPGISHGETDEFGHHAVQGKVHMHDMHATLLHLLGRTRWDGVHALSLLVSEVTGAAARLALALESPLREQLIAQHKAMLVATLESHKTHRKTP